MIIREFKTGEASLTAHFYFKLFESQFDFVASTEQYFMRAAAELFDDENNRIWIAVDENDKIYGSISIIKIGENKAQLRLFGIDPSLQGHGIGRKLMKTAMDYCKDKNFTHIILWTIDICKAALNIYKKFGFKKTAEKPNTTWANYPMTEELWEYT